MCTGLESYDYRTPPRPRSFSLAILVQFARKATYSWAFAKESKSSHIHLKFRPGTDKPSLIIRIQMEAGNWYTSNRLVYLHVISGAG